MATEHSNTEVWKAVVGYEGLYEVSSQGRVRRIGPNTGAKVGRILKLIVHKNGYICVGLSKASRSVMRTVHVLMCEAFYGQKPDVPHACVRHLNGVRSDNRLENVCWGTAKENTADSLRHGTYGVGERHRLARLTQSQVDEVRQRYAEFMRVRKAQGFSRLPHGVMLLWAEEYGVGVDHFRKIVHGRGYNVCQTVTPETN